MEKRRNSIANALELHFFYIQPSIYVTPVHHISAQDITFDMILLVNHKIYKINIYIYIFYI